MYIVFLCTPYIGGLKKALVQTWPKIWSKSWPKSSPKIWKNNHWTNSPNLKTPWNLSKTLLNKKWKSPLRYVFLIFLRFSSFFLRFASRKLKKFRPWAKFGVFLSNAQGVVVPGACMSKFPLDISPISLPSPQAQFKSLFQGLLYFRTAILPG